MTKPSRIRQPGLPASKYDDEPPIIRLTKRVKALEYEARALALQYERWVDGVGQMMSRMNATADKLAKTADELGNCPGDSPAAAAHRVSGKDDLDPGVYAGFEEFDF